jgi:hypothetical protein
MSVCDDDTIKDQCSKSFGVLSEELRWVRLNDCCYIADPRTIDHNKGCSKGGGCLSSDECLKYSPNMEKNRIYTCYQQAGIQGQGYWISCGEFSKVCDKNYIESFTIRKRTGYSSLESISKPQHIYQLS